MIGPLIKKGAFFWNFVNFRVKVNDNVNVEDICQMEIYWGSTVMEIIWR